MVQQIPSTLSSGPLATTTRRRYSWSTLVVTGNHDGGSKFIKQPNSNSNIRHRKALSLDATLLLRYHLSHGCLDDDDIVTGNCNGRFSYVNAFGCIFLSPHSFLSFLFLRPRFTTTPPILQLYITRLHSRSCHCKQQQQQQSLSNENRMHPAECHGYSLIDVAHVY